MKTAMVSMRIDAETKNKAERVLSDLGINMSTAFNMMCRQVILQNGIPFSVKMPTKLNGAIDISNMSKAELSKFLNGGWGMADDSASAKTVNNELKDKYGL